MSEKDPSGTPSPASDEAYLAALRGTPTPATGISAAQPVPSAQLSMSGAVPASPPAAGPAEGSSSTGGSSQLPHAGPELPSSEIGPLTAGAVPPPPAQYAPAAGPPPGAAGAFEIPAGATLPAPSAGSIPAATPPSAGAASPLAAPPRSAPPLPSAGGATAVAGALATSGTLAASGTLATSGSLAPITPPPPPEARGLGVPFTGAGMADTGGVAVMTAPPVAPPGSEWIVCPECGLRAAIDPAQRRSDDFCKRCDYPLFWARSAVVPLSGDETGASLRRLPGTVGRAATASVPCPHCNEPNSPTALICIRCGRSMLPDPEPEPEPEPVYVAPPPPEPEPEKAFPLWWVVVMCVCLLIITILVAWVALS